MTSGNVTVMLFSLVLFCCLFVLFVICSSFVSICNFVFDYLFNKEEKNNQN